MDLFLNEEWGKLYESHTINIKDDCLKKDIYLVYRSLDLNRYSLPNRKSLFIFSLDNREYFKVDWDYMGFSILFSYGGEIGTLITLIKHDTYSSKKYYIYKNVQSLIKNIPRKDEINFII